MTTKTLSLLDMLEKTGHLACPDERDGWLLVWNALGYWEQIEATCEAVWRRLGY